MIPAVFIEIILNIQIWVVTMYLGQVLKEISQMPRPTCPPAFPMENQHKVSLFLK